MSDSQKLNEADYFDVLKWSGLFQSVEAGEAPSRVCALVNAIVKDEKWETISEESYQKALAKIRQESTLDSSQFNEAMLSADCFARLQQRWFKDFGSIHVNQFIFLNACATLETPQDQLEASATAFYPLYTGLTPARKKVSFLPSGNGRKIETRTVLSDKNIRPIGDEKIEPGMMADLNVLLREVPDSGNAVRSYVEGIVKNAQVLRRESGHLLHYSVVVDLTEQYVLRSGDLSIANYDDALFIFQQKIDPEFIDRASVMQDLKRFRGIPHHSGGAASYRNEGRGRAD